MVRSHVTSAAQRECRLRRYQNKLEYLNLQDMQSVLKLRAIEMARLQKIKNLEDRLKSHDLAIELMRQRHMNEIENCRELNTNGRMSSLPALQSEEMKRKINNKELKEFEDNMGEKYEKLVNEKFPDIKKRPDDITSYDGRSLNYRQVKDMLNHLPITPIFKETTYALTRQMNPSKMSEIAAKYEGTTFPSICNNVNSYDRLPYAASVSPVENYSYILTDASSMMEESGKSDEQNFYNARGQRDVRVPPKDLKLDKTNDLKSIKSSLQGSALKSSSKGPKKSVSFEGDRRLNDHKGVKRSSTVNGTFESLATSSGNKENSNKLPNFTDFMISKNVPSDLSGNDPEALLQKKRKNYRKSSGKKDFSSPLFSSTNTAHAE